YTEPAPVVDVRDLDEIARAPCRERDWTPVASAPARPTITRPGSVYSVTPSAVSVAVAARAAVPHAAGVVARAPLVTGSRPTPPARWSPACCAACGTARG